MSSLISRLSNKFHLDLAFLYKNGIWTVLRQLVVLATSLFLSMAMARLLSQELFGKYQLFLSILSIVAIFSLPGLNTSVVRSVARGYEGSYQKSVRKSLLWSLFGIPVLLLLGIYYHYTGDFALGWSLMISAVLFPLMYAYNTWDWFLQAKERFDIAMKYSSVQSLISAMLMVLVIFLSPNNLFFIILVYLVLNSFFNIKWYLSSKKYIANNIEDPETISYGKFLTKINIISLIASQIDKLIVGVFIGPAELAVYAVGINIARRILDILKSIMAIYTPRISKTNTAKLPIYLKVFLLFTVIAVIAYFIMPYLIEWLYTTKYSQSVLVAQLVVIFLPFFAINSFYKNHILFFQKNKKVLIIDFALFPVIKIAFMAVLLILFGIVGLAFTVGFQYVLDLIILYLLTFKIKSLIDHKASSK